MRRLNPFGTGRGLSTHSLLLRLLLQDGLNPFGTGRGLSTTAVRVKEVTPEVSIPLEQGGVFRQKEIVNLGWLLVSIPLEQGGVFRHYKRRGKR